jgi:hypothetical protein
MPKGPLYAEDSIVDKVIYGDNIQTIESLLDVMLKACHVHNSTLLRNCGYWVGVVYVSCWLASHAIQHTFLGNFRPTSAKEVLIFCVGSQLDTESHYPT